MKTQPSPTAPSRWVKFGGPLTTVMTIAIIEAMAALGFRIPNPPAFLVLSIVFSAFTSGFAPGLVSAVIAWMYLPYFFSIPGRLFHYTDADLLRVIVWAFTLPLTALMVGVLKHRSERVAVMEQSVASLQEQIDERKQAEDALRASEIRFRAIVEGTTDLICRFLPDTTLTFVNESYCRYFNQSRGQLIGKRFLTLIPEGDWESVQAHVNEVRDNKQPVTYAHEVITPSGEMRWQQWTDSAILDDDGRVIELQSVGRDVTEQKMAEKSLQESEQRFHEMLQGVDLAGVILDRQGRVVFINDFLLQLAGWTRVEALGRDWFDDFLPPDARENVRSMFSQMNAQGQIPRRYENEIITRAGQRRLVHWSNTMLFDLNGRVTGTASIGDDVTERTRAERERESLIMELEAKNAELEQFTYTVSHDLKSPLVTIKGFLGFLEEDLDSGDRVRFHADIERIKTAAARMEQLLKELLELSRIGRKMNPPQEIRFEQLAREAMELVHGQLEAHGAEVHIQPHLPAVYGDHQRLVDVLQNLIDNASKFRGSQAHLQIEIGQRGEEDGMPVFYVRDNGIGIAPEHHERIFGLFNKLDPSAEGTGVGLALVKRIVEAHGGRIWVESESGRGAAFYFTLPTG
jgi:PAS domain S-box-containing protein